jgi:hypothetical protein
MKSVSKMVGLKPEELFNPDYTMKDPRSIDKNFVGSQEFFIKTQLMKQ